jgi:hypothetical protein
MKYGTGSGSDPTNGSISFYVSKSPSNWEAVISKYERISEDNPGFRWAASEIFQWEGYSRMLISRTAYPSDYH